MGTVSDGHVSQSSYTTLLRQTESEDGLETLADSWCLRWSLVSGSQFWLKGKTSFLVCRVLIGALQGGFIPDLILYMSYFFTGKELPFRLALFWLSNRVTAIASPLLAFGLLHLQELGGGVEGWRW